MLHKFHHSATEMGVFTARRDNPLVVPIFILFTGIPVAIFGAPSAVPQWITFLGIFHALIIHSQIQSNWGWIGQWVIVSPYSHKVHHSKDLHHFNKNFAFMFPVWDRLFGTFYHGVDPVYNIGVEKPQTDIPIWKEIAIDISCAAGKKN